MKTFKQAYYKLTVIFLLLAPTIVPAQNLRPLPLRNGTVWPEANIKQALLDDFDKKALYVAGKSGALLQFATIPAPETRALLTQNGITLLQYVGQAAYTVTFSGQLNAALLKKAGAVSLIALSPQQKIDPALQAGFSVISTNKKADLRAWLKFTPTFSVAEVLAALQALEIDTVSTRYIAYGIIDVRLGADKLMVLAAQPFTEYLQAEPGPDEPLNNVSRSLNRANVLNASVANGGKGLNGEGVVAGIGDNADIQYHVDFTGRLINRTTAFRDYHGVHTAGTMAGAGIVDELYRGYAPRATVINQYASDIIVNSPTFVQDYNMLVTNNSYSSGSFNCASAGSYDLSSTIIDQQSFSLPHLQHVFAAGNSGSGYCPPYPSTFATIPGGYQPAKNVISVGWIQNDGIISQGSSKGPVKDGRIKPEVVALGVFVKSAIPDNTYGYMSGSSMASPAVAGSVALLYQRYRQLHGAADPDAALIKALICNGATDKGNKGIDYTYGFGAVNLLRSVDMLDSNRYKAGFATQNSTAAYTITVPANTAALKVMLYWNDPAASLLSTQKLVNDLDLEVDSGSVTLYPQLLNPDPGHVNDWATTGADHINNIEQVVIDYPAAGSYTASVKGTAIAQNPSQPYYLVYDIIPKSVKLAAPAGGEGFAPAESTRIEWDVYGNAASTYTLQYSTDSSSWVNIPNAVGLPAASRFFDWLIPADTAGKFFVRVIQDATSVTSSSNSFTVIGIPVITIPAAYQCPGYINLLWNSVNTIPGLTGVDYEVLLLKGSEMVPVATTTDTNYVFNSLAEDSVYWVTVRARVAGKPGRRALAAAYQPSGGSCNGAISNNDLKLAAIISPVSGRKNTSTELTAATSVTVQIKNLDDTVATGGFVVKYSLDSGLTWVSASVSASIGAGAVYNYTFSTSANLSAAGTYNFIAVVKNNSTDPATGNDTARALIKQLANAPLDLTAPFTDNVEAAQPKTYQTAVTGIDGDDRYDYSASSVYGRLRSFVNTGIAHSGSKAFTLDADRNIATANNNYLTGTFNLSNYTVSANDIRMNFWYNSHGQAALAGNEVWIRGSDTSAWIKAYDFSTLPSANGIYKKSATLKISELLNLAGQQLKSSFSVQWRQAGNYPAATKRDAAGYTYDDIHLFKVNNDIELTAVTAPADTAGCSFSAAENITIGVRNNQGSAVSGVPVKYRINGGAWITTETTPAISAYTTSYYTFTAKANLATLGHYVIEAVAAYSGDDFPENDTAMIRVISQPFITSYPYFENFETNDGFWYTGGTASSWAYGTPASGKINSAASGTRAWKTSLTGTYHSGELSYLYSPCFTTTGMSAPTLSFALALDLEDCSSGLCDGAWVEYSTNGTTWTKLGAYGSGVNWYNSSIFQLWSVADLTRWHVATIPLPAGQSNLRLRFVLQSDPFEMREGVGIDDIHIYDNPAGIYDSVTMTSPVTQTVSGTGWNDFTSGGKLIASIHPAGQNMGSVDAQAYINTGSVRNTATQYYHDRNLTIKTGSSIALTDSVTVRFYFLDAETVNLVNATGCAACVKPADAWDLGVSKYSGTSSTENGTIADDSSGSWSFIPPGQTKVVPFDKGYYAEFKVKSFSEFWLNGSAVLVSPVLPVKLVNFEAQKSGEAAVLTWLTATETATAWYEIERAESIASSPGNFVKIGEVAANSHTGGPYSYTDGTAGKQGLQYYRLKIVDRDGRFTYSPVRSVLFGAAASWTVMPNPSKGLFNLTYKAAAGQKIVARILDAKGSLMKEYHTTGTGFTQKLEVDVTTEAADGLYLLQVTDESGKVRTFKLYIQKG